MRKKLNSGGEVAKVIRAIGFYLFQVFEKGTVFDKLWIDLGMSFAVLHQKTNCCQHPKEIKWSLGPRL